MRGPSGRAAHGAAMSSPATGSFYSVATFIAIAGAFTFAMHLLLGWEFPSENRAQTTVTIVVYCASGFFAMKVGRHRDVTYLEAGRRAAIDIGRALNGWVMR